MKIRLLSDLHMEGYQHEYITLDEDVLVLAGDIHTQCRHEEIIDQVPEHVQILFVAGNHEYYRGEFHEVNRYFKALESEYKNFKWLNNDRFIYKDVDFFGGTMYSDFTLDGEINKPIVMSSSARGINDFYVTRIEDEAECRTWTVRDHEQEFLKFERELKCWLKLSEGNKRCVISHFAPSARTVDPQYQGSLLNGYFTREMEQYMGWEGLWLYGHTHSSYDIMSGETRIVANPKGYGAENRAKFNPDILLEI